VAGSVVVLASDWDGGSDPVPYYIDGDKGCLDFNSSLAKPRPVLTELRRRSFKDCEHQVTYDCVVCGYP